MARAVAARAAVSGWRNSHRHIASHAAGARRLRQQRREPLSRRQRHLSGRRRASERQSAAGAGDRAGRPRQRADRNHRNRAGLRGPPLSVPRLPDAQACPRLCALQRGRQRRRRGQGAGPAARADGQRDLACGRAQSRHRHQPARPSHHVEGLRRRQRGAQRRVRGGDGGGRHGRSADAVRGRADRGDRRRGSLPVSGRSHRASACPRRTTSSSSANSTPRARRSSHWNCCRRSGSTRSRRSRCSPITSPGSRSAAARRNGSRRRARPPTTACRMWSRRC